MHELPLIMVAPNGARRTKSDHPELPMDIADIVATAAECYEAGAGAIHAHVRDKDGRHILDAGLYRDLLAALKKNVPDMMVQVTTEAVGQYTPPEQMNMIQELRPEAASLALRELFPIDDDNPEAIQFYHWCQTSNIHVQHILYDANDVKRLARLAKKGAIPDTSLSVLYVLGRYTKNLQSNPSDLLPFLEAAKDFKDRPDWMVCAFGQGETDCLEAALKAGGKVRVGFENSLYSPDGTTAPSNAARVRTIRKIADHYKV